MKRQHNVFRPQSPAVTGLTVLKRVLPLGTHRTSRRHSWVTLQVHVHTCRSRFLFQKLLGRLSFLCMLLGLVRWVASTTRFTLFSSTLASLTFRSSYLFLEWGLGQSPPPQIEIGTGIIPLLTSTNVAFAIYASREYQRAVYVKC